MKSGLVNVLNLLTMPIDMKNNIPDIIRDIMSPPIPLIKSNMAMNEHTSIRNSQWPIAKRYAQILLLLNPYYRDQIYRLLRTLLFF